MSASHLQRKLNMNKLPPMPPPSISVSGERKRSLNMMKKRDYSPVSWHNYFTSSEDIQVSQGNTFRVYKVGSSGPVICLLHGGGYSALTWAVMSKYITEELECQCLALDLRGHGDTVTEDEQDLSAETQARDVGNVIQALYGNEPPPVILVGHSMGGAIAVHVGEQKLIPSLVGLVVLDVVEGTALEALSSMQNFLRGRPAKFTSMEQAIEWCVRSGQVRNLESAKVSMVGQIKRVDPDKLVLASDEVAAMSHSSTSVIQEEEEEESTEGTSEKASSETTNKKVSSESTSVSQPYTWRVNLSATEPYWRGWFQGLSNKFLSVPAAKMLLLAGVDRLDKDLTVGQMQGKFQMQVLPQCGHAVHEDSPDKVADVLAGFCVRNKFAEAKGTLNKVFPSC